MVFCIQKTTDVQKQPTADQTKATAAKTDVRKCECFIIESVGYWYAISYFFSSCHPRAKPRSSWGVLKDTRGQGQALRTTRHRCGLLPTDCSMIGLQTRWTPGRRWSNVPCEERLAWSTTMNAGTAGSRPCSPRWAGRRGSSTPHCNIFCCPFTTTRSEICLSVCLSVCVASSSSKLNGSRRSSAVTQLITQTDDHKVQAIHSGQFLLRTKSRPSFASLSWLCCSSLFLLDVVLSCMMENPCTVLAVLCDKLVNSSNIGWHDRSWTILNGKLTMLELLNIY